MSAATAHGVIDAVTGWDCHAHVFGPYGRYPLSEPRAYTPPAALADAHAAHLARLGLSHGVLVHPSAYGDDHSLLFDTLAARPRLRGVVVPVPESTPDFAGMRERGVRGARFSHRSAGNFPGAPGLSDLARMAPALADAGLHAELWTDCAVLPALCKTLARLPVPVVLDHMGGFNAAAGIEDPGFGVLLDLLSKGHIWVKLCAYRNLLQATDFERGAPFQRAMFEANPHQLVWGSDWPYLRVEPAPEGQVLLDAMRRWAGDERMVRLVLEGNPEALYG
ncbi:amidohydrolase family protein [uncultured Hydrogenophaga sp.]|uniref:amidohydrolase family protein n=1 Tax=uncultured Hydrogenophaga sp. TaxID=199683 RepID=UPI00258BD162|nr:amidohydrolase family protein [uncultured Hydrogenophaga sp.]